MVKSLSAIVKQIKSPVAVKQASQGLSAALAKPDEIDDETMVIIQVLKFSINGVSANFHIYLYSHNFFSHKI